MKYFVIGLFSAFFVISCDKKNESYDLVPPGSKPGWNAEQIDSTIGCEPFLGQVCMCVVPEITTRFTPEEVRRKSVPVSQTIEQIYSQCRLLDNPPPPQPSPETGSFKPGVLVKAIENASLYYGNDVVGYVIKGHQFRIKKIQEPWAQIEQIDGTKIDGWILLKHLSGV